MRRVVLVTGPPCAGKTTYAQEHAAPGDLILDQDDIGAAAMNRGLEQVRAMRSGMAWVIRCCPGHGRRAQLAADLAAELVHLQPATHILMARARTRRRPAAQVRAVQRWLADDAAGGPGIADPEPVSRTAW